MPHSSLDGGRFRDIFIAGSRRISEGREYLNSINVFPVPDGDTGSNMADTMNNAVDALSSIDDHSLPFVLETLSGKLRMEARGNSGIILAEFFHGMFLALKDASKIDPQNFVVAISNGKDAAYASLADPKEGTILTVIRKTVDNLTRMQGEIEDMKHAIECMVESGRKSLEETKDEMQLLKENDIVDSGAHGFLLFWEGALMFLKGELIHTALEPLKKVFSGAENKIKRRYCTEGLAHCDKFDRKSVVDKLNPLGDSLIVTGGDGLLKVHIHTNDPDLVFDILGSYGDMVKSKVDDMVEQSAARSSNHQHIRIMTDSTCDLDLKTREELGIEMAPLQVIFGEKGYRDRVDLSAEEFYEKLKLSEVLPRTSLPKASDFLQCMEHLSVDCDRILGIYVSSTLSGTWQVGKKWGDDFDGTEVTSYDSGHVSLGMGMMILEAAKMAGAGCSMEEITARLDVIKKKLRDYVTVDSLEHLARGGRIGQGEKLLGQMFGLKPILRYTDGKILPCEKGFGRKRMVDKLIKLLEQDAQVEGFEGMYAVVSTDEPELADELIRKIKENLPVKSLITGSASPVVVTHCGPGSMGVFCY